MWLLAHISEGLRSQMLAPTRVRGVLVLQTHGQCTHGKSGGVFILMYLPLAMLPVYTFLRLVSLWRVLSPRVTVHG